MGHLAQFKNLEIDWSMTPEEAVTLYLEWGNNWRRGERQPVRSKEDYSNYFIVNTWEKEPKVYLIQRNSEEAKELAELKLPDKLRKIFFKKTGQHKGVFAITPEIQDWLKNQM